MMDRKEVESSNIISIGYDEATKTLEIEFKKGEVYHYFLVPKHLHTEIMNADSHGRFLNDFIKKEFEYKHINA